MKKTVSFIICNLELNRCYANKEELKPRAIDNEKNIKIKAQLKSDLLTYSFTTS